jgi:hypothetical protein
MTSARLTISTASDRLRALRFNSRLSGGAKTTLPKLMPTNIQHSTQRITDLCTSGAIRQREEMKTLSIEPFWQDALSQICGHPWYGSRSNQVLYIDFKTEFNIASGLSPANAPVFFRDFSDQDLYMINRNAESLKVLYDRQVQLPFCIKRSTCEGIDTDVGVELRICPRRRAFKTVRFVNHTATTELGKCEVHSLDTYSHGFR